MFITYIVHSLRNCSNEKHKLQVFNVARFNLLPEYVDRSAKYVETHTLKYGKMKR